ncbi:glycosyltransferase family 4 protein [Candidatus Daviesbacteria bacterium]|nr:glycosyltransferase family 4 protein [Candidatus Daviesbacteria bacterium]
MLIGFDGSRAFAKGKTGTENYSYYLLKALAKIDTENQYKVYIRPGCKINKKDWPDNFEFFLINYSRFWTQIGLALQTFEDKLDLLFVPAHTLPLFRKPGLKTIMTVHDLGAEYLPSMHQLKQNLYLGFITNFQLKTATRLIAVSESTKADLVEKGGVKDRKIQVIYEGVDRDFFKLVKSDRLRNSLKSFSIENKKYFLFVGTIQPRKNLERIIKAFSAFTQISDDYKLVLVGAKGWKADQIYKLPKELGIEDRVKFLGRVSNKYLPSLYSGALALVYLSLYEGFGLPILEAMSSNCPVITSNISSMPEVAGEAAILVNPADIEEITTAMSKIASDDRLRDNLIHKGQVQAKKFSWDICAKKTLQLFKSIYHDRNY